MNFCPDCTSSTTASPAPGAFALNGCGTRYVALSRTCSACGSHEERLFLTFLWIPLVPLGRYRFVVVDSRVQGWRVAGRRAPGGDRPEPQEPLVLARRFYDDGLLDRARVFYEHVLAGPAAPADIAEALIALGDIHEAENNTGAAQLCYRRLREVGDGEYRAQAEDLLATLRR